MKTIKKLSALLAVAFLMVSVPLFAQEENSNEDSNIKITINEEEIEKWAEEFGKKMEAFGTSLESLKCLENLEGLAGLSALSELENLDIDVDLEGLNIANLMDGTHMHIDFDEDDHVDLDNETVREIEKQYGSKIKRFYTADINIKDGYITVVMDAELENGERIKHTRKERFEDGRPKE
ncbi:hypothetical protein V6R21_16940 [Limibacter armeniacum]|uniref:hypothetical protein n=1 Tax=Limibacter armeniacum TaxID=466084 RepID=UPI002FE5A7B8